MENGHDEELREIQIGELEKSTPTGQARVHLNATPSVMSLPASNAGPLATISQPAEPEPTTAQQEGAAAFMRISTL